MNMTRTTRDSISRWAMAPEPDLIRHMGGLDREWDVERAIEFDAAAVMLAGLAMGAFISRVFYGLAGIAAGMLLTHAASACDCPPKSMLCDAGFRTRQEIDHEKAELEQAMRARVKAEAESKGNMAA